MFAEMHNKVKQLLQEIIEITYFMRGSVQYQSGFILTFIERQQINEFLKKRIEKEVNNPHPQY